MEKHPNTSVLNQSDIDSINHITNTSDVIPQEIREQASADIIKTLENNHPLNKIWRDDEGKVIGYLAFEDFSLNEAYAKYLATEGLTNESPFSLIPDLIKQAKDLGYSKIHFHGFNKKLNKALSRFGFQKIGTDVHGEFQADHFELKLDGDKPESAEQKIRESWEQKYLNHLIKEVEKTQNSLKDEAKEFFTSAEQSLVRKLSAQADFGLTDKRKLILKLKLARYLQRHDTLDANTLTDAIVETPKWLDNDKGGFDRLLEVHEQKTLERIAEIRVKKAEQTEDQGYNPFEALFETTDGQYYLARLLNMPHLEKESQYMNHCVGTSDSYINKMKRGDVEILSFRTTPHLNQQTQKMEGDEPIITIEYNIRTKTIEQIKKKSDEYLRQTDQFFLDFVETLKRLRATELDNGQKRDFKEINASEMTNIEVKDYHLFTENGEVSFKDFDPDLNILVLKMGKMDITPAILKIDQVKIIKIVENIDCLPEQIANKPEEISETTTVYIGPWNPAVMQKMPQTVTHIYESFPDKKVFLKEITPDPDITSADTAITKLEKEGHNIGDYTKDMLTKVSWSEKLKSSYEVVSFFVSDLFGDKNTHTFGDIKIKAQELGLDLIPPSLAPSIRLNYPKNGEWALMALRESIRDRDGSLALFDCRGDGSESWLHDDDGHDDSRWYGSSRFVFVRK